MRFDRGTDGVIPQAQKGHFLKFPVPGTDEVLKAALGSWWGLSEKDVDGWCDSSPGPHEGSGSPAPASSSPWWSVTQDRSQSVRVVSVVVKMLIAVHPDGRHG